MYGTKTMDTDKGIERECGKGMGLYGTSVWDKESAKGMEQGHVAYGKCMGHETRAWGRGMWHVHVARAWGRVIKFDAARLNEGSAIQETLQANKGKYYQSCRKLFSIQTLERARKKSANSKEAENIESSSNSIRVRIDHKCSVCFLCQQTSSPTELR